MNGMQYRQTRFWENCEKRIFDGAGVYGIPQIKGISTVGEVDDFVGWNYAKSCKHPENKAVHFFVDDYQFVRLWAQPNTYLPMLSKFKYVFSPDFSTFTDFPKALQIYNHYRKHWLGAYLQENGVTVIPTISWAEEDSCEWCFDGEPCDSVVTISSVGCMKDADSKRLFLNGYNEMVERLHPSEIIFYGTVPDECTGNIVRVKPFHDKWRKAVCNGW